MHQFGDLVLPGDEIILTSFDITKNSKILLGPGLRQHGEKVFACKAGILKQKSSNLIWVDSVQKRYIPCKGETVIGVVVQKSGDIFRIDIGANELAALPYLSFEGASKKNRPNVNIGDIVFAKLLVANKDFESELICMDSIGKKQKLGVLRDGFMFNGGVSLARKLRGNDFPLIGLIQQHVRVPFEIVVGMNGRVWLKTNHERDTIAVANIIIASQLKGYQEMESQCSNVGVLFNQIT